MQQNFLSSEWQILQKQSDQFETWSLILRLVAIVLLFTSLLTQVPWLCGLVFLLLWLQDAIWKTFQARTENRLIEIERAIADDLPLTPYQFNYPFSIQPRSSVILIGEYLKQALRPTNALLHMLVIGIFLCGQFI
ncbi:hypothetical protein [Thalassotalea fusca]